MYIRWKDEYCVGVSRIDEQHFRLVEMLNELYRKIGPEITPQDTWSLLQSFNEYAETHFSAEERIARDSNVDIAAQAAHRLEHESYRDRMANFRRAFEQNDKRAPVQLMAFLSNWWLSHILIRDMELGRLIREQEEES